MNGCACGSVCKNCSTWFRSARCQRPDSCNPSDSCEGCQKNMQRPIDMINHPPHYTSHPSGVECIAIIREAPRHNLGVAMKYIWRTAWGAGPKDTPEQKLRDLEKAMWHLSDEVECMRKSTP